ncbi:glycoside hydrolase family 16 protein [Sphingopyxis sp. RIFCSPHIGHO2_12_FULL_65_19]|uniref:glycoside hydrolase family 16 protein n=1 Tax=Sphingopyxis sp. RIFCSPHIGHO2_12_FULL_65_19 TaxID=1802172 RepID=UPI0008BDA88A|nr:glycoside hydrolase family 16 protein [Sphingopyxis sp. RIFCSPHIGHO2_12_FULL_65_19]OHD06806.1 MAG: glucan endo-1,3-beta-D-glucosidase [Sphingopyxis sp. RIFCSPHIGHO2_12_FULL_65_19]
MIRAAAILTLAAAFGGGAAAREPADGGWRLAWSDEFGGTAIDRDKWDFDVDCWGGGNNERQCYTDRPANAAIKDGKLVITARKEAMTGPAFPLSQRGEAEKATAQATKPFTSARLVTRGKAAWTYGKIEVRAKLPQGQGTWPAIWMLPEDGHYGSWAASGEIDILEAVNLGVRCETCAGGIENRILGTLHFGGQWPANKHKGDETALPAPLDGFHVFGIVWQKGKIVWTVDGKPYATRVASEWSTSGSSEPAAPFDRPFHLILNLAVGGGLAEDRGLKGVDENGYPKNMEIDWVRVWQCDGNAVSDCSSTGDQAK